MLEPDPHVPHACAVCARVLNVRRETHNGITTGMSWVHDAGIAEVDHPPVPVPQTEITVDVRCDFCFGHGPHWTIPARDFTLPLGTTDVSTGDWGACDPCAELVAAGNWDALLRRVLASYVAREPDCDSDAIAIGLMDLYRELRRHITGPAYLTVPIEDPS